MASDPGTPAELKGIQKAICALERLMKEALGRYGAVPPGATGGVQTRHIPTWPRTSVKSDASSLFSGLDRCSEIGFRRERGDHCAMLARNLYQLSLINEDTQEVTSFGVGQSFRVGC
jgi:hypothetical protein